jgi:2-polyprenyl-3-methyl-5-hydroxy-6-metoxy-1,4-benzoquinol methylase
MSEMDARRRAGELARDYRERGDELNWFEALYAGANRDAGLIPWADLSPNPLLAEWLERDKPDGTGKRAVVIGCGLGDDAEAIAARGYDVTAFDISPSAIEWCNKRWPETRVHYVAADLFNTPDSWRFDFVLESYTVQALSLSLRSQAIAAVARLVAPGGRLLVIGRLAEADEPRERMPWPLTRAELAEFESAGLRQYQFEVMMDAGTRRFRALYERPA